MAEIPEAKKLKLKRNLGTYFRLPVSGEAVLLLEEAGSGLVCTMMELGLQGKQAAHEEAVVAKAAAPLARVSVPDEEDGDAAKSSGMEQASSHNREANGEKWYEVNGRARVRFLSLHTHYTGEIVDLSMSGCRVWFEENIPMSVLRRRVETEFEVDGMAVAMPGVTQVMHDRNSLEIRFVEVTEHKQEQLRIVMAEVEHRVTMRDGADAQRRARSRCNSR